MMGNHVPVSQERSLSTLSQRSRRGRVLAVVVSARLVLPPRARQRRERPVGWFSAAPNQKTLWQRGDPVSLAWIWSKCASVRWFIP